MFTRPPTTAERRQGYTLIVCIEGSGQLDMALRSAARHARLRRFPIAVLIYLLGAWDWFPPSVVYGDWRPSSLPLAIFIHVGLCALTWYSLSQWLEWARKSAVVTELVRRRINLSTTVHHDPR